MGRLKIDVLRLLEEIVKTPSVSGYEENTGRKIMEIFREMGLKVDVDVMGNVIGYMEGEDPKIMITAHMDQIGLMVNHIDEKGYIYFTQRGFDKRLLYGIKVVLHGSKGPIIGVIGAKPIHLVKTEEREKVVDIEDMAIDIGVESKSEVLELGINIGTVITPKLEVTPIGKGRNVAGVGLDDKAGIVAMIKAMEILMDKGVKKKIYAVATTQEELGLRGATTAAYRINPDVAFTIDVTHASSYNVPEKRVSGIKLGGGPAIGIGPNFHPKLSELIIEVCKEHGIPYQIETIFGPSGTDAFAIQVSRGGVATALLSIPLRYMHSTAEIISITDIENTAKALAETIIRISGENYKNLLTKI